jgi:Holliday junction resolvase-like predicted endonuclease
MATIKQAVDLINAAHDAALVDAGQMYLTAQRIAKKSRAACAFDVMCRAHLGAVMVLNRATDARERSILGQVCAESKYLFNGAV